MKKAMLKTLVATAVAAASVSTFAAPTIKLGHVDGADWQTSKKGAAGVIFKNIVEGETDIKVELFPAKALGNEGDLVQQAQEGTTHMAIVSGAMAKICKEADVLNIPYIFSNATIAWDVLDGQFGQDLAAHCLEETGLRTLAYGETGFRNFTNNVREIKSPADMKGLKFRVQPIPLYVEMVEGLGGEPTPIAWSELPNALTTGVVDGQENPVGTIYNNNLHKLQKYMVLDGHVYAADFIVINDEFFQSLSAAEQDIIAKAARTAGLMGRAIQQFNTAEGVTKVVAEGMKVHSPTADEMAQFKKLAQPAVKEWLAKELGSDEWIAKLDAAVEAASK
ncbi:MULTISPECIES: DctP family TRAP transporter solute-binding subunit [unclassified Marinobacterium]|uniref:DctP family TRAP transporter solute-binding subunit n=1 Tax=unclassified Marinobacterium TaxID=2644139 RepID=UPI00156926BB|nr:MULTISPECIES: DctP family TRAP transporter solute-binding subunit [unclassified Marinobacterium]NRP53488.1 2,3-diketo-L-gulonate-binding periplasmic protein YiaO precursor [Marinobacterium sp. xm-v-242]NRP77738.1 2,3-diketo-L-gulonate-binding periplasmic protein YiaO precursor [Marinobacterium sp. xm-m-383]